MSPLFENFHIVFLVVLALVVIVAVFAVVSVVRNVAKAKASGLDPLTLQTDLAAKVINSDLLASEKPMAQKLADVDALLQSGAITPEEHGTARAAILAQG